MIDNVAWWQGDVTVLGDVRARVEQIEADHRLGVMVGPLVAGPTRPVALRGEPERLGVDERAIHVPQHSGGQQREVLQAKTSCSRGVGAHS